ncbi:hypothetical protein ACFSHT_28320, partial [Paraburkholderia silviterrae]
MPASSTDAFDVLDCSTEQVVARVARADAAAGA